MLLVSQVLVWVDPVNVEDKYVGLVTFPGLSHQPDFQHPIEKEVGSFGVRNGISAFLNCEENYLRERKI